MHAMIRRRDDEILQRADVHVDVGVFPELDQQADRITDAGFERAQVEHQYWHRRLRDVVDERVQETGAEPGEPVELLDRMMPRVGAPERIKAMLRAVNPVDHEIHQKNGYDDAHRARQPLQRAPAAEHPCRRCCVDEADDHVVREAVHHDRQSEGENVDLQILPAIHLARGPDAFQHFKYQDEREESRRLNVFRIEHADQAAGENRESRATRTHKKHK